MEHMISRLGMTDTGQFLGTVDYVAPEQIRRVSPTIAPTSTRSAASSTSA